MGEVIAFAPGEGAARLTVAAPDEIVSRLKTGDSVAVSGVCLTALEIEANAMPPRFSADLAAETIARTTLSRLAGGAKVNLELPTPAGEPLGGHVVQGHVDGVGTLTALEPVRAGGSSETDWTLRVRLPGELMRYVVEKGSIAVEGISLTVAGIARGTASGEIWLAILPHTYAATNLHTLKAGVGVNLEVDVLAKYAEGRADVRQRELTVADLLANGY